MAASSVPRRQWLLNSDSYHQIPTTWPDPGSVIFVEWTMLNNNNMTPFMGTAGSSSSSCDMNSPLPVAAAAAAASTGSSSFPQDEQFGVPDMPKLVVSESDRTNLCHFSCCNNNYNSNNKLVDLEPFCNETFIGPNYHIPTDNWCMQEEKATMNYKVEADVNTTPTINNKIEKYSVEERKKRILRYLNKRNHRNFNKTIKYACRKTLADKRVRIRGRFAKNNNKPPSRVDDHNHIVMNSSIIHASYEPNMTNSVFYNDYDEPLQMIYGDDDWFEAAAAMSTSHNFPYTDG